MFSLGLLTFALATSAHAQSDANKTFQTNCSLCHGAHGAGDTPTGKALKAADLRSAAVQKSTDAELASVIAKGRGKMPAFEKKLSPDVIKSLVAYIRQLPQN